MPDKEHYRWLFSLKAIDALLDNFNFGLEAKHTLAKSMADDFGKEFSINEPVIQQFSDKYRKSKNSIVEFMHGKNGFAEPLYSITDSNNEKVKLVAIRIMDLCPNTERRDEIMRSLIHMTMNRVFVAQQRKHEVVLYGFLERYYRSEIAKEKYCKKDVP